MMSQEDFQVDEADFQLVREIVHKHCGIALTNEKKALVRARVAKEVRAHGFSSAREYLDCALALPTSRIFSDFISAISTNLTAFFRESAHFDYLTDTVLPHLLKQKRLSGDRRILAWNAGCSSGEEPYSLAMTLVEFMDRHAGGLAQWDPRILASDISTRMLAIARAGTYDAARLTGVPPSYRSKYFVPVNSVTGDRQFAVSPELRQIVRCRQLNLMDIWPFKGPFDFIFCRNTMIYFDRPTQQRLINRFWSCLRPGGFFFTGHSESLTGINDKFIHRKPSVYEKQ